MGKEPSAYIFSHAFDDFGEFSEATRSWQLKFVQLDRGIFRGKLFQAGIDGIQVLHARFNRQLHQRGTSPNGMQTFAIAGERSSPPLWRNKEIHRDSIMFFTDKSLDVVSRAGFDVFSISIKDELLKKFRRTLGYTEQKMGSRGSDTVVGNPETLSLLRRYLHRLTDTISQNPRVITDQRFTQKLKQDLSANLLGAIASSQNISLRTTQRLSDTRFRRIETYIKETSKSPLMISDLCEIADSSERTLRRAFGERYGISPMRYVKCIQLNRVRKDLKRANPTNTKIIDIANRWGFWHMGQFASDYRRFFGELPSETLARINK